MRPTIMIALALFACNSDAPLTEEAEALCAGRDDCSQVVSNELTLGSPIAAGEDGVVGTADDPTPAAGPDGVVGTDDDIPASDELSLSLGEDTVAIETPDGIEIDGSVSIQTPAGPIHLVGANLVVERNSAGELETLHGIATLSANFHGMFDGVSVGGEATPLEVEVLWGPPDNTVTTDLPIDDDRNYLVLSVVAGRFALMPPTINGAPLMEAEPRSAGRAVIAIEPSAPTIYLNGAIDIPEVMTASAAVGISADRVFTLDPVATYGADSFGVNYPNGNLLLAASVPVPVPGTPFDLTIDGEMLIGMDTAWTEPPTAMGMMGNVSLSLDLSELSVAGPDSTFVHSVTFPPLDPAYELYVGSEASPTVSFAGFEPPVQLSQAREWSVSARGADSLPEEWQLAIHGTMGIDDSKLEDIVGFRPLSDLATADASFLLDQSGTTFRGELSRGVPFLPGLTFDAGATVQFDVDWDSPEDFELEIRGEMDAGGIALARAEAIIDVHGVSVEGFVDIAGSEIFVQGTFRPGDSDMVLRGGFDIALDVSGDGSFTESVTDAALCGTEWVADGALCGWSYIESGAQCGTEFVTSGAQCGYDYVTSGAQCGWDYTTSAAECGWDYTTDAAECGYDTVTSGAQCGYDYVTDAAECGFETITSAAECGVQTIEDAASCLTTMYVCDYELGFIPVFCCDTALTCQVEASCNVAATCSVPASCNIPASCNVEASCSVPATCEVAASCNVPDTCEVPNTCDVDVEGFVDLGRYDGRLAIEIGTDGLSGEVGGQLCPLDLGCTPNVDGSLRAGPNGLEVCLEVTGIDDPCFSL